MPLTIGTSVQDSGGRGRVGTATCPVTGKHVRVWEEYVAHEASYATGGTSIMPQLAAAGIVTPTAVAIASSTSTDTGAVYTLYNDAGTWKLKCFTATGAADDTAAEEGAATVLNAASSRIRIYGLP